MARVLVIGEKCLDVFHYGTSTRNSPEADAPVFVSQYMISNYGMAYNVSNNLNNMGVSNQLISNSNLIIKTRFVDIDTNKLYMRFDEYDLVNHYDVELLHNLEEYDAVIISDYCKGFLNESDIEYISQHSRLTILDTKKKLGDWCKNVNYIKLNRKEALDNISYINGNTSLKKRLVITLDSDGALYDGKSYPAHKIDNPDVSGAGDTFVAGFTSALLNDEDVPDAIKYANYCASQVVAKRGVAVYTI